MGSKEQIARDNRTSAEKRAEAIQTAVAQRFETGIDKYRDQEIKELGTKVFAPIADVGTAIQSIEASWKGIQGSGMQLD
jgi:hypothetical protein